MGLFSKKGQSASEFWRTPPFRAAPEVLYQQGIDSVTRDDGPGMMKVGWNIWRSAGMDKHQARDFLIDGYQLWRQQPEVGYSDVKLFLLDLLDTLASDPVPTCPSDVYSAPSAVVESASAYFGTIAWAGAEIFVRGTEAGDQEVLNDRSAQIYQTLATMPFDFVPPRSAQTGKQLALRLGLTDPFPWLNLTT